MVQQAKMIEELIKKEAKRFEKSENWEKEVLQDVKEIGLSENQFNYTKPKNNTSGYKGVGRIGKKWVARIRHQRKQYHIGTFGNVQDAVNAYDSAARRLFGEFALPNNV